MFFSIVIPIFNSESYLRNAVNSVILQEFDDYEIILVDDGSVDKSPAICDELENTYKSIKVIHQHNKGSAAARNAGMLMAQGEYVLFLDADDEYKSGLLNFLFSVLNNKKLDVLCFGYCNVLIDNGKKIYKDSIHKANEILYKTQLEITNSILDIIDDRIIFNSSCTKAYRRELLKLNNIFMPENIAIGEDFCFNLNVLKHCESYYFTCDVFYEYIAQNKNSIMRRFDDNKHNDLVIMHQFRNDFLSFYSNSIKSSLLDANIKLDYIRSCYSTYMDMFLKESNFNFGKKLKFIEQSKKTISYDYKFTDKSFFSKKQRIIFNLFATQNNFLIYLSSYFCYFMKFKLNKSF